MIWPGFCSLGAMKQILLLLLVFIGRVSFAQTTASAPFKGANVILVQTSDSASTALMNAARVFVAQGFVIDKLDKELNYLTTQGKPVGQLSPAVYTYKVVAAPGPSGATLRITGEYTVPVGLRSITSSMHWYKGNMTQDKACFNNADNAAKAYPGGVIRYEVR